MRTQSISYIGIELLGQLKKITRDFAPLSPWCAHPSPYLSSVDLYLPSILVVVVVVIVIVVVVIVVVVVMMVVVVAEVI